MSFIARRTAAPGPTHFTSGETQRLAAWGQAHGLEVVIEPADAAITDEVMYVGYGQGPASWTLHRSNGHLWLARIGDRSGQPCEGWLAAVGSIEAAIAWITAGPTT